MHTVITVFLFHTTDLLAALHTPWFSDSQEFQPFPAFCTDALFTDFLTEWTGFRPEQNNYLFFDVLYDTFIH